MEGVIIQFFLPCVEEYLPAPRSSRTGILSAIVCVACMSLPHSLPDCFGLSSINKHTQTKKKNIKIKLL